MTKRELELRAGVTHRTVLSLAGEVREENRRQASVRWDCAVRVAEVLGVESTTLPLARRRPRKSRRRLWLRRQRKLTGGRWDEAYVRFRHALDEFARCAGEDVSWDDAYAHWYEIEKTLVAAMRRDERYAP